MSVFPKTEDRRFETLAAALEEFEFFSPGWLRLDEWMYCDALGQVVGAVVYWFTPGDVAEARSLRRDASGWAFRDLDSPSPLFRLPMILEANTQSPVFVCNGERTAAAMMDAGQVATACAGKAADTDWSPLAERSIVILRPHGGAGWLWAREAFKQCHTNAAKSVRILDAAIELAEMFDGEPLPVEGR